MATRTEVVIAFGAMGLVVLGGIGLYKEQKAWERYAKENNCKVIATERGRYYHTPDGKGGTNLHKEADRTTYRCDDGTTHTR